MQVREARDAVAVAARQYLEAASRGEGRCNCAPPRQMHLLLNCPATTWGQCALSAWWRVAAWLQRGSMPPSSGLPRADLRARPVWRQAFGGPKQLTAVATGYRGVFSRVTAWSIALCLVPTIHIRTTSPWSIPPCHLDQEACPRWWTCTDPLLPDFAGRKRRRAIGENA